MWLTKLWIVICPILSWGLRWGAVQFSVKYFKERRVPFVCVVTCSSLEWDVKFTKAASSHYISVSSLNMDHLSNNSMVKCFQQQFTYVGVLMDVQCDTEHILYYASQNRWLDFKHVWLMIDETNDDRNMSFNASYSNTCEYNKNSSRILTNLRNMNISVDADIILATPNDDNFKLRDVFNFGKVQGGDLVVKEIGDWKPHDENIEMFQELNRCKYYKRFDFGQSGLRIISVATSKTFDPHMLTDVRPVPGVATITRTSSLILAEVADIHNIKFIHTRTDRWLGTYENNASRAVSTSLYFQEQDVTSAFRYLESLFGRVTIIHPSVTTIETRYFYRIPTTGPGKFENQFLRPLSAGTWLALLAISAICTVIMVFAARLEARPTSVQYAVFSVVANFCQQFFEDDSYDMAVKRISTARKLTMFVTGMACLLVYNFYTSSVVSWLLNGPPPSITSLEELVESPLQIIFEDTGYTHSWLTVPGYYYNKHNAKIEDVIRLKVLSKKRNEPLFAPLEKGIAMVKAGGYAYHTERSNAAPYISATFDQDDLCELGSLTSMEKVRLYPGVQVGSPYKEFLTWSLTRLLERGIISCMQRRTDIQPASCQGSSPRALALGGAAPAFILLGIGYLLATGIMVVEKFVYKMKQRCH